MSWDRWTDPPGAGVVIRAAAAAQEAAARARVALLSAGAAGWVSSAASAYDALLDDAVTDVARVQACVGVALDAVLPHVRAADTARAAAAQSGAELRAALRALGRPGPGLGAPGTSTADHG